MGRLIEFAASVPDFRRTAKGNIRHKLSDMLVLIVLGRMSGCVRRMDIIEFGNHNLRKFRSMGLLKNGVPSERPYAGLTGILTACAWRNGCLFL